MKAKIYNYGKIEEKDIHDRVIRVKALMVNTKEEILLGEAFGTIQFIGGHLEENETLIEGLKREVKEETGIVLKEDYKPFFAIKYFLKDFPVLGNNRSIEIYYFYIVTDEEYHLDMTFLDDQERKGNFQLRYVSMRKFKQILKEYEDKNKVNKLVNREMRIAMKEAKKRVKNGC